MKFHTQKIYLYLSHSIENIKHCINSLERVKERKSVSRKRSRRYGRYEKFLVDYSKREKKKKIAENEKREREKIDNKKHMKVLSNLSLLFKMFIRTLKWQQIDDI